MAIYIYIYSTFKNPKEKRQRDWIKEKPKSSNILHCIKVVVPINFLKKIPPAQCSTLTSKIERKKFCIQDLLRFKKES
jgi:hypothetical protein